MSSDNPVTNSEVTVSQLFHDVERLLWVDIDRRWVDSEKRADSEGTQKVDAEVLKYLQTLALMEIAVALKGKDNVRR